MSEPRPRRPTIGVGTLQISPRAKRLVMETLDRNRLSYGPMSREFEERFGDLHECRFAVLSNSGTSALHVALAALKEIHGWADGDEVIVPALTFVATVNVVLHNNLTPVLVDTDPEFYELDPQRFEDAVTSRTRAVMPVHLFGQPCDMGAISEVARRRKLRVVEDSCQTMFAKYRGRSVGSIGDIGCFSTYVAHLLTTGVGGICTTNDPDYAVKLRSLVNHGRDSIYFNIDDDDGLVGKRLQTIVERRFKFVSVGHSFRVTEMEAALGLAQIDEWESMIRQRQANARFLSHALAPLEEHLSLPSVRNGSDHSFMMYPLVLRAEPKSNLVMYLEEAGIGTRDMMPVTNQPVYHRMLGVRASDYPQAEIVNERGFVVGCHQNLTSDELDYMVEVFHAFWRRSQRTARARSLLIVAAFDSGSVSRELAEQIPASMFDDVVILHSGEGAEPEGLKDAGSSHVRGSRGQWSDPWSMLQESDVAERYEHIVLFRLDGREDPGMIGQLLLGLQRGNDMVVGSRFGLGRGGRPGSSSASRRAGNRVFTFVANLIFSGFMTDSLTELRAFRSDRWREARVRANGLVAAYELSIAATRLGWRVAEIPTVEQAVNGGRPVLRAVFSIPFLLWALTLQMARVDRDESYSSACDFNA